MTTANKILFQSTLLFPEIKQNPLKKIWKRYEKNIPQHSMNSFFHTFFFTKTWQPGLLDYTVVTNVLRDSLLDTSGKSKYKSLKQQCFKFLFYLHKITFTQNSQLMGQSLLINHSYLREYNTRRSTKIRLLQRIVVPIVFSFGGHWCCKKHISNLLKYQYWSFKRIAFPIFLISYIHSQLCKPYLSGFDEEFTAHLMHLFL